MSRSSLAHPNSFKDLLPYRLDSGSETNNSYREERGSVRINQKDRINSVGDVVIGEDRKGD